VDASLVTVSASGAILTAGAGGAKLTGGTGVDTITGGTGADTLVGGAGADVIVGGGGKDVITGGTGADKITLSGNTSTLVSVAGDSGANISTSTQTSMLTTGFDVVFGASAGTTVNLSGITSVFALTANIGTVLNLAGVNNSVVLAKGTYDAAVGSFTYATNGADSVLTYDTDATLTGGVENNAFESIVLVGYNSSALTTVIGGVITL
jgi:S-layer protein